MNIILDMDHTLLDGMNITTTLFYGKPRPYLGFFLRYVFSKFKKVSIWTHATSEWFLQCYEKIISHHMPPDKNFFTIITRDNNIIEFRDDHIKELNSFYKIYPCHNSTNTIIIDDIPHTYSLNINNALPISPYIINISDNELLKIINYLDKTIFRNEFYNI